MDSGNINPNVTIDQSPEIKFNFSTQNNVLIIEALCSKDNQKYVGSLQAYPVIDFQDIKEIINEGQFKVLVHNEEILKIKAGPVQIQLLVSKQNLQIKELHERLTKFIEENAQMQSTINYQKTKLCILQKDNQQYKEKLQKLKRQHITEIDQLKKTLIEKAKKETATILQSHQEKLNLLKDFLQQLKPLKPIIQKVNPLIKKMEQEELKQELKTIQIQKIQATQSFKWSEQLKSKQIQITGNVIKHIKKSAYWQFCLLNVSFSNNLKQKQSWTIKINKKTGWEISLGVCLKSKILKSNFNDKNINWKKTGHGLYMIHSNGICLSHSQYYFNCLNTSFEFYEGNVIYIEYDPIKKKIGFNKNKKNYFEMPIIAPPQNDVYHPFILLKGLNSSVELIQKKVMTQNPY